MRRTGKEKPHDLQGARFSSGARASLRLLATLSRSRTLYLYDHLYPYPQPPGAAAGTAHRSAGLCAPWFRNVVLRRAVPFTGAAGLGLVEMTTGRVEIGIRNEKKVQNHIGGVHASAMNLLAETATGMVVGMNVRDDCIPLAKE